MPFTISHAAAVLPLSHPLARWRVLSATIIGSMVPDFGFLLPWRPPRVDTHTATSLLTFGLPVGLAAFWLFQRFIKPAVVEVLPDATYARWGRFATGPDLGSLGQWLAAACAVTAGAVTHLVWDAFTHEGARGVRMIPALDDPILDIAGHHLVGVRLLQDVSSLIGLSVVLAYAVYGLRRGKTGLPAPARTLLRAERLVWLALYAAAALLFGVVFLALRRPSYAASHSLALVIGNVAIAALRGFAAALIAVSFALMLRLRADRAGPRATALPDSGERSVRR